MSKFLLLPFLFVGGCGAGVAEMTAGRPSADDDVEPEISSEGAQTGDTASSAPEVRIETSGGGSVFESVASSERYLQWLAVPAPGWVFDRWELVGSTFREDGTEVIYRGGFFRDNPLELDSKSEGVLTAVFFEDDREPEMVDEDVDFVDVEDLLESTWQVIAGSPSLPFSTVVATAFAVEENMLATNAHVVEALIIIMGMNDGVAVVVQHETGDIRDIAETWVHAAYNGDPLTSPDIGVIRVRGAHGQVFGFTYPWVGLPDIGSEPEISVLDPLILCGFPGDVSDAIDFTRFDPGRDFRPRASCLTGTVSSLRPFDPSDVATPDNTFLIQHDIATTGGTSGSAIISENGQVIAINSASTTNEAGLNRFAVRSDLLQQVLTRIRVGSLSPLRIPVLNDQVLQQVREKCFFDEEDLEELLSGLVVVGAKGGTYADCIAALDSPPSCTGTCAACIVAACDASFN
ncbi:MAG: trypsin-like peptidase domain-containing protein [Planctomycetes bacterium]|nr:trypsin-like peptidase domain-containing protein [Planctomycetota bacterium]